MNIVPEDKFKNEKNAKWKITDTIGLVLTIISIGASYWSVTNKDWPIAGVSIGFLVIMAAYSFFRGKNDPPGPLIH